MEEERKEEAKEDGARGTHRHTRELKFTFYEKMSLTLFFRPF